jgi:prepilin-type N-terminal cleavage/methylation domain-containing protein
MKRAFTLIELLVCVAVMSLLVALLLPTLSQAKQAGRESDATAKARQLAVAANLYREDQGAWPISADVLVRTKSIPQTLLASPADPISGGTVNMARQSYRGAIQPLFPVTKFPQSFFFADEWLLNEREFDGRDREYALGFTITAMNPAASHLITIGFVTDRYLRIHRDTSVSRETFRAFDRPPIPTCWKAAWFLFDHSDEQKAAYCQQPVL